MTQDFAKKKSSQTKTTRKPAKRKTNTRKPTAKKHSSHRAPAWAWLLIGAFLGAFIVFLVHLSNSSTHQTPSTQEVKVDTKAPEKSQVEFDFYKILKEQEVEVSEKVIANTPTNEPIEYLLQVGSFKKASDADRLRAQLILLSLEAKIEAVTNKQQQKWHRVTVGPYRSRSKLAKAQSILASNEIKSLLLKRKIK